MLVCVRACVWGAEYKHGHYFFFFYDIEIQDLVNIYSLHHK